MRFARVSLIAIAILGVAAAAAGAGQWLRSEREPGRVGAPVAVSTPSPTYTDGLQPAFVLPEDSHPVKAVTSRDRLVMLATPAGAQSFSLFTRSLTDAAIEQIPLSIRGGTTLAGLAVGPDGSVWAASLDLLVRIDRDGTETYFQVPRPLHQLPPALRGPAAPAGLPPTDDGQVTALAYAGDRVLIGRLGYAEITVFDPASEAFSHEQIPSGLGDVSSFATTSADLVYFTVNRSGRTPGLLFDAVGLYVPAAREFEVLEIPARALSSNGLRVAFSGFGIGLIDPPGETPRPQTAIPATAYDQGRLALRRDEVIVLKVAAAPEIALVSAEGPEIRRIAYAAVIGRDATGAAVPYSSALAFITVGPQNETWFALFGRPEVYRLD